MFLTGQEGGPESRNQKEVSRLNTLMQYTEDASDC